LTLLVFFYIIKKIFFYEKFMFIVFEWVDWSWKDTQLEKVLSYLRQKDKNIQIWLTKEPTKNTIAWKMILEKLALNWFSSGEEALALFAKDREEQTQIRKEILKHSTILSSRFDYSTFAYQWAQWVSFEDIYKAHNYENILIPDLTFIFDVSIENIEQRLKSRWWKKEFFENLEFLKKVREKYLETYEKLKDKRNIYLIDANKSVEEVFENVKKIIDKYF